MTSRGGACSVAAMLQSVGPSLARWLLVVASIGWFAAPRAAAAQDEKGTLGLGIILGEPSGVSAKLYLSDDQAIAGAAGSALVGGGLQVHGDYLWHPVILEDRDKFVLPLYVGPGLRVFQHDRGEGGDDDVHLGIRGVGGLVFDFKEGIPLDVFVEVAAVLDVVLASDDDDHSGVGIALNAGAGARYYF